MLSTEAGGNLEILPPPPRALGKSQRTILAGLLCKQFYRSAQNSETFAFALPLSDQKPHNTQISVRLQN